MSEGRDLAEKVAVATDFLESLAMPTRDATEALAEKLFVAMIASVPRAFSGHTQEEMDKALMTIAANSFQIAKVFVATRDSRRKKKK